MIDDDVGENGENSATFYITLYQIINLNMLSLIRHVYSIIL